MSVSLCKLLDLAVHSLNQQINVFCLLLQILHILVIFRLQLLQNTLYYLPSTISIILWMYVVLITGYHMVKTWSLYLTWPWIRTGSWQTDIQTKFPDRIPIANTHSQQYLPVQLSRVKMTVLQNLIFLFIICSFKPHFAYSFQIN